MGPTVGNCLNLRLGPVEHPESAEDSGLKACRAVGICLSTSHHAHGPPRCVVMNVREEGGSRPIVC